MAQEGGWEVHSVDLRPLRGRSGLSPGCTGGAALISEVISRLAAFPFRMFCTQDQPVNSDVGPICWIYNTSNLNPFSGGPDLQLPEAADGHPA